MSNSSLVSYTKLSPNCTKPRKAKIDTITIHCMAGDLSVETCGRLFEQPSRESSSNYGIGSDGRIALYVDEANRSWCSSSSANDNRAVTIEVANIENKTPWKISDKAMISLINLCVDICKRNGIKKLLWKGDKNLIGQVNKQNMTVHRWFKNKDCPGDYLYSKHGYIADEVNKRLTTTAEKKEPAKPIDTTTKPSAAKSYTVKVTVSSLNIRKGPGTNYAVNGRITDKGKYTVIEESKGSGSTKGWGKLKSGAGWISLDHITKV